MDRSHWRSPGFHARSPHPNRGHPRFRGDGGGYGAQRSFSPHWQQRNSSPYRYPSQHGQGGGGSYSPHFQPRTHNMYATSTPVHGSGGGRRPYFRGGGGGRYNKRLAFGTPSFMKVDSERNDDISLWVSEEMWDDPWRFLRGAPSLNVTESSGVTFYETQTETQFAESDFQMTTSGERSKLDCTTDSDLNTANDQKIQLEVTTDRVDKSSCSKSGKDKDTGLDNDDSFEKYATDRVVLDSDEQVPS